MNNDKTKTFLQLALGLADVRGDLLDQAERIRNIKGDHAPTVLDRELQIVLDSLGESTITLTYQIKTLLGGVEL